MQDIPEIISERLYDRTSENYGMYKVIQYLGIKGKTNVPYFLIKFKRFFLTTNNFKNIAELS